MKHITALHNRGIEVWVKPGGKLGLRGNCSDSLRQEIVLRRSEIIGDVLLDSTPCTSCGTTAILQEFEGIAGGWRWWECPVCGEVGTHEPLTGWMETVRTQGWVGLELSAIGHTAIITRDRSVTLPKRPAVPVWALDEVVTWMGADPTAHEMLSETKVRLGGTIDQGAAADGFKGDFGDSMRRHNTTAEVS